MNNYSLQEAAAVINNNVEIALPWENDNDDLNLIHTTANFMPIADSNLSTFLDDEFFDIMQNLCDEEEDGNKINDNLFDGNNNYILSFSDHQPMVAMALPVSEMVSAGAGIVVAEANVVNVATELMNHHDIFATGNCMIDLDNNNNNVVTATTAAYTSSPIGAMTEVTANVITTIPLLDSHKNVTMVVTETLMASDVTAMLSYAHVEGQVKEEEVDETDGKNEKMVNEDDGEYDYGFILDGDDEEYENNDDDGTTNIAIAHHISTDEDVTMATSSSYVSMSAALKNKLSLMDNDNDNDTNVRGEIATDDETKSYKKSRSSSVCSSSSSSSSSISQQKNLLSDEQTKLNRAKAKAKWMKKKERLRAKVLLAAAAVKDCFTLSSSSSSSSVVSDKASEVTAASTSRISSSSVINQNNRSNNTSSTSTSPAVLTVSLATVAAVGGESMQWNKARKAAAAKRERVNGKFKRCQTKWMGVSDYYGSSSSNSGGGSTTTNSASHVAIQQHPPHQSFAFQSSTIRGGAGSSVTAVMNSALSICPEQPQQQYDYKSNDVNSTNENITVTMMMIPTNNQQHHHVFNSNGSNIGQEQLPQQYYYYQETTPAAASSPECPSVTSLSIL